MHAVEHYRVPTRNLTQDGNKQRAPHASMSIHAGSSAPRLVLLASHLCDPPQNRCQSHHHRLSWTVCTAANGVLVSRRTKRFELHYLHRAASPFGSRSVASRRAWRSARLHELALAGRRASRAFASCVCRVRGAWAQAPWDGLREVRQSGPRACTRAGHRRGRGRVRACEREVRRVSVSGHRGWPGPKARKPERG